MAGAVSFLVEKLGQLAGCGRRFFSSAVIIGGTADVVAELPVLPAGAKRLTAFEAGFWVRFAVGLGHRLICSAKD